MRKISFCRDLNSRPNVSEGYMVTSELPGRPAFVFKKNLNASKPSEHPPQVEECLKVYVGTLAVETKPLHGIKRVPQCNYIGSTV